MTEFKFEELWEPWWIDERPYPDASMQQVEIPPELIDRFKAAKAEMEEVWNELEPFTRDYD